MPNDWTSSESISPPEVILLTWRNASGQERSQQLISTPKSNSVTRYTTLGYTDESGKLNTQDVAYSQTDIKRTTQASANPTYVSYRLSKSLGLPAGDDIERTETTKEYITSTGGPILVREQRLEYVSEVRFVGGLGLEDEHYQYYTPTTAEILAQKTIIEYETVTQADGREVTRTRNSSWKAFGRTQAGNQEAKRLLNVIWRASSTQQSGTPIALFVGFCTELRFEGTDVQTSVGRAPVPTKPSDAELVRDEVVNGDPTIPTITVGGGGVISDSNYRNPAPAVNFESIITGFVVFNGQAYDDGETSVTATYDMPYAPDDYFAYPGDVRTLIRSGARAAAEKFGRTEALLDIGHAFGQNIVTGFNETPTLPLAPVYIRLAGIEGAFLFDSTSYAWGPEGMVVSSDLMLLGVTGYYGSAPPSGSWVRLPVPTSAIGPAPTPTTAPALAKANTIALPSGFDPRNPAGVLQQLPTNGTDTYVASHTTAPLVPPVLALEKATIISRPVITAVDYVYALDAGTDVATIISRPVIQFYWQIRVQVPAAVMVITAMPPVIDAHSVGAVVVVPAAAVVITGQPPVYIGTPQTVVAVPAAAVTMTAAAPMVITGVFIPVPAASMAVAAVAPAVSIYNPALDSYWNSWTEKSIGVDRDWRTDWWVD